MMKRMMIPHPMKKKENARQIRDLRRRGRGRGWRKRGDVLRRTW